MGSWRVGRCSEGFPEVVRLVVTEYGVVASRGDPIHARNMSIFIFFCDFVFLDFDHGLWPWPPAMAISPPFGCIQKGKPIFRN